MSKAIPQTGILLLGPGAQRINTAQGYLPYLTSEQLELVNKAKKYATDLSLKTITTRQAPVINQQQQHQQKSSQRHQALVLMCRVYVGSISFEVREETIKAAFSLFGAIKSINMSFDQITHKHKGFAFVEYELPEAAQLALEHMNGIQLGGRQIKVGRPSNLPQAAPIIHQIQEECKENNRIYLSNLHPDLYEPELATIFEPFGKVRTCWLAMTPNVEKAQHRGYGFVEFDSEAATTEALTMENFDLGGQAIHVCRATTPADHVTIYGTLDPDAGQTASTNSSQNLAANQSQEEDIQAQLERANKEQQSQSDEPTKSVEAHMDSNGSRHVEGQVEDATVRTPSILVLRNMVTADDELDDSLQLDVYDECRKYGAVLQVVIHVDKCAEQPPEGSSAPTKDEVKIFVKFADTASGQRAKEALNGRFFAGRKVSAEEYDRNFFRRCDYTH